MWKQLLFLFIPVLCILSWKYYCLKPVYLELWFMSSKLYKMHWRWVHLVRKWVSFGWFWLLFFMSNGWLCSFQLNLPIVRFNLFHLFRKYISLPKLLFQFNFQILPGKSMLGSLSWWLLWRHITFTLLTLHTTLLILFIIFCLLLSVMYWRI